MSTMFMSTGTIGNKLRKIRVDCNLSLRKVALVIDIDVAVLSKMERGERKFSKEIVLKLSNLYKYSSDELLILFLSDRILYEIQNEEFGEEALKVAEERVKYYKKSGKALNYV